MKIQVEDDGDYMVLNPTSTYTVSIHTKRSKTSCVEDAQALKVGARNWSSYTNELR